VTSQPSYRYHPFYCEENVFHLAREPALADRRRRVVFITNPERACAVWHQRAAERPTWPIFWDYHVVLLVEGPWEVWDFDTLLGLPVPAADYLRRSFPEGLRDPHHPRFRVVDAEIFAETFASDRSHMRGAGGRYQKPPPPWPAIGHPGAASNLMRFADVTTPFLGEVIDLSGMLERVAHV
jgi:hypothetical protein